LKAPQRKEGDASLSLGMTRLFLGGKGRSGDPDLNFINKQKPLPDRRFFPSLDQIQNVILNPPAGG